MYLMIGIWGTTPRKNFASNLFILFTLFGSILLILSMLLIYYEHGTLSFLVLSKVNFSYDKQVILCLFTFIAFAIKIPIFPFHI